MHDRGTIEASVCGTLHKNVNSQCVKIMETKIITFDNYNSLKSKFREFFLPPVVLIDPDTFNALKPLHGQKIKLDTSIIFFDRWANDDLQLIIPDLGRVENSKFGFYLEQSEQMRMIRDSVYQCSFCNSQYYKPVQQFCTYCINSEDMTDETLYLTFLRPVSTLDITLQKKSIVIPAWLKEKTIPELLPSGKIINV